MGGSVVTSCSLHVLLSLPVVYVLGCVLVREGNKNRQNFTGCAYVQNRPHTEKPGKSSLPLSLEKTSRARHASDSARIELKPRPQVPDGLPVSTNLAFCLKARVRRYTILNRRKIDKYTLHVITLYHWVAPQLRSRTGRERFWGKVLLLCPYRSGTLPPPLVLSVFVLVRRN